MFMNEALSDAILVVGRAGTRIPVHSLFLQSCSEVMGAMFNVNWKTNDPIPIKEYGASPIVSLLRWIYCSELVFESEHLLDLMRAAHMFMIHPLIQHVVDNFHSFTESHVLQIFDFAVMHEHQVLKAKCLNMIGHRSSLQTFDFITMSEFENISPATIAALVSDDELLVDELILFLQCLRWAKAECSRNGQEVTSQELRSIMSPFHCGVCFRYDEPLRLLCSAV